MNYIKSLEDENNTRRIEAVQIDIMENKICLLYDDGSKEVLDMAQCRGSMSRIYALVGLTLEQAKIILDARD